MSFDHSFDPSFDPSLARSLALCLALAPLVLTGAGHAEEDPRARLRLLSPRALAGERTIEVSAQALAAGAASLELRLDGRAVARGPAPRLDARLELGWPPRPQRLEAAAFDARGCPVGLELAFLRAPARAFPVELAVTGVGCDEQGPWAHLFARPPVGRRLDRALLYADQAPIGEARELPARFRLTGRELAARFLRAEVRLDGGTNGEALHLFAGRSPGGVIEVRRGEARRLLGADQGAPATLTLERVTAAWRGRPQRVVSVEAGSAVPLALAIAVDASPSTLDFRERVLSLAAETARTLAPAGAAAAEPPLLLLFSETSRVALASAEPSEIAALADALPFGVTALFDALAAALHENLAPGRRAALLAVTDGCDTGSQIPAERVRELALALGVPVHALVFDQDPCYERVADGGGRVVRSPGWGASREALRDLCAASGGGLFRVAGREDLARVWKRILADLERQAVVVYEPSDPEVDPAEVEIAIAPPPRRGPRRR